MLSGKRFRGCIILIMLLLSICLLVTGCTRNIPETLNLSENAAFYNYSGDNILSLKSIIVDSESQDNRIIFEFDDESEYVSRDVIKTIMDENSKYPYPNRIEGDSVNYEKNTKVEAVFDNGSNFIILNFDPDIECNYLYIIYGYLIEVRGPWNAPGIELTEYGWSKDGIKGDLVYYQMYDKDRQKWNECEESFIEDVPLGLD
ncbi:MAG: hypothetical protein IK014_00580 [Lachnospiraceae bacterium]|nr:hypothetical protein [Lachnospiraceae bacterium]